MFIYGCADPSGRAVFGVGLRPLASWDCGFDSRRDHGYLSLLSVVCCQVEFSMSANFCRTDRCHIPEGSLLRLLVSKEGRSSMELITVRSSSSVPSLLYVKCEYVRTPLIRINWEREPSGYAEIPDNWILL
jgi:hypothetical protein